MMFVAFFCRNVIWHDSARYKYCKEKKLTIGLFV